MEALRLSTIELSAVRQTSPQPLTTAPRCWQSTESHFRWSFQCYAPLWSH